jgi:hypothetical protein
LLKGIHIHEEFIPTTAGAAKPKGAVNTIVPVAGKQAAVTFGVGVTSQVLHNAVSPSKLLTIGAAHGSVAPAGGYVSGFHAVFDMETDKSRVKLQVMDL